MIPLGGYFMKRIEGRIKMFLAQFLVGLFFVSSVWAQGLPTAVPEDIGMSSERLLRIDALMQDAVDQRQVSGTVVLIGRQGKIGYFKSFGTMDEGNKPMATDTMFRIASMTKPVTSVAVMMLWEDGRFLLDEPVSKYLSEFKNPMVLVPEESGGAEYHLVPAKREITIRHLLSHTAGITYAFWGRKHLTGLYRDAGVPNGLMHTEGTIADGVRTLASMPLMNHPGEAWEYGLNTDVPGRLVEVVSGMPLDQFFQERIFRPLQMVDTHFFLPADKVNRLAAVYTPNEDGGISKLPGGTIEIGTTIFTTDYPYEGPMTYFSGGGGLSSTTTDYARFLQMLLNGGELEGVRLLGPKTVDLMTRNHTGDFDVYLRGDGYGFGLGFAVLVDPDKSGRIESKGEYNWGGFFYTKFWVDPKEELIAVMMAQLRPNKQVDIDKKLRVLTYQTILD
jgi:CubicO group peptidase (beta-lactamase class C family)